MFYRFTLCTGCVPAFIKRILYCIVLYCLERNATGLLHVPRFRLYSQTCQAEVENDQMEPSDRFCAVFSAP